MMLSNLAQRVQLTCIVETALVVVISIANIKTVIESTGIAVYSWDINTDQNLCLKAT